MPPTCLRPRRPTFHPRRRLRDRRTDRAVSLADIARVAWDPPSLPDGMEPGLVAKRRLQRQTAEFPQRRPYLRTGDRSRHRHGRDPQIQRCRRRRHRDEPAAARGPDLRRHRPGRRPILMEDIHSTPIGAAGHRLVHGLRDAPGRRPVRGSHCESNPVPPRPTPSASRAPAKPAPSGRCRRSAMPSSTPQTARHPRGADAATPERLWRPIRVAGR